MLVPATTALPKTNRPIPNHKRYIYLTKKVIFTVFVVLILYLHLILFFPLIKESPQKYVKSVADLANEQ